MSGHAWLSIRLTTITIRKLSSLKWDRLRNCSISNIPMAMPNGLVSIIVSFFCWRNIISSDSKPSNSWKGRRYRDTKNACKWRWETSREQQASAHWNQGESCWTLLQWETQSGYHGCKIEWKMHVWIVWIDCQQTVQWGQERGPLYAM